MKMDPWDTTSSKGCDALSFAVALGAAVSLVVLTLSATNAMYLNATPALGKVQIAKPAQAGVPLMRHMPVTPVGVRQFTHAAAAPNDDVLPSVPTRNQSGISGLASLALIPFTAVIAYFAVKQTRKAAIEPLDLAAPLQYRTYTMLSATGTAEGEAAEAPAAAAAAAPAVVKPVLEKSYGKIIESIENKYLKPDVPKIEIGDTLVVGVRIREGDKERVQEYEGVAIAMNGAGLHRSVTVRKTFQGVGVERGFPLHASQVAYFKVLKQAKVRRAKLYYLRGRSGKASRLKQRIVKKKAAPATA